MRLAILSDCRLPTNMTYAGHGLGRSAARLAMGLARRGHEVTVFAGPGSAVERCHIMIDADETERADTLAMGVQWFDCYIDSTHQHRLSHLRPEWPVICKCCDQEGTAPNRRVYGSELVKEWLGGHAGLVIHEGVDVDNIPFNPSGRNGHLLYPSTAAWKKTDVAADIAGRAGRDLWLLGDHPTVHPPPARVLGGMSGEEFYRELGNASAVLSPIGTMATLEAAACGTPSIGLNRSDGWIEHGVSGWIAPDTIEAAEYCERLDAIRPERARQWVADCRNIDGMAAWWERACQRAIDGEVW